MKKGISIWAFGDLPLGEALPMAKKASFEGVELAIAESGEINLESTKEEILKIRQTAENTGIELYSLATGLYWQYPLTSDNPETREKAEYIAHRQIEIASWLGCESVLIVPGTVDENVAYDTAFDRALRAMKKLEPAARSNNIIIGVENVWNKMLLSPLEMRDFIDAAGSPFIQTYFDVGNVIRDGYAEQWIKILGNRITKVHFKDYIRENGTLAGFCDLLEGDVNFPAVISALNETGYTSWVTSELFPGGDTDLEVWVPEISKSMDKILGGRGH